MFKTFSHIYIEEGIKDHVRTKEILAKFPNAIPVLIRHYKDSFNRNSQNFRIQKETPKLILAEKKDQFLYPGSDFSPNFSHQHFYYNTMALNCIYDCEYCYLQGMFPSANLVLFVNWEVFFFCYKYLFRGKQITLPCLVLRHRSFGIGIFFSCNQILAKVCRISTKFKFRDKN